MNTIIEEQPILYTDDVCCGATLNPEYNCVENYCELTLATCAQSCLFCCNDDNCCNKYDYENNTSCDKDICRLICLFKFPFTLIADICMTPCKTFLYCEKCMSKNKKMGTEPGNDDFITMQPVA